VVQYQDNRHYDGELKQAGIGNMADRSREQPKETHGYS
jgi:hypothetical protein